MKPYNFDVHIVTNELSSALESSLLELGFEHKNVIGGDPRVRMKYLLSLKASDKKNADDIYKESISILEQAPSFRGYIEEEAVIFDRSFHAPSSGIEAQCFPEKFQVSICPPGTFKKCDIHVTFSQTNKIIIEKLNEAGFYYLELNKPHFGEVNVMTIQTENLIYGKQIWQMLISYLEKIKGFEGFAKLEVTVNIKNFGFVLPPIILGM
jgi:hypothetical protein